MNIPQKYHASVLAFLVLLFCLLATLAANHGAYQGTQLNAKWLDAAKASQHMCVVSRLN